MSFGTYAFHGLTLESTRRFVRRSGRATPLAIPRRATRLLACADSVDLDVLMPTYFDNLALLLGVPKDQWGGGP